MWRGIPSFSFSVGERKLMNHFVAKPGLAVAITGRSFCEGNGIHHVRPLTD